MAILNFYVVWFSRNKFSKVFQVSGFSIESSGHSVDITVPKKIATERFLIPSFFLIALISIYIA